MADIIKSYRAFLKEFIEKLGTPCEIRFCYGHGPEDKHFGFDYKIAYCGFGHPGIGEYEGLFYATGKRKFYYRSAPEWKRKARILSLGDELPVAIPEGVGYYLKLGTRKKCDFFISTTDILSWKDPKKKLKEPPPHLSDSGTILL